MFASVVAQCVFQIVVALSGIIIIIYAEYVFLIAISVFV